MLSRTEPIRPFSLQEAAHVHSGVSCTLYLSFNVTNRMLQQGPTLYFKFLGNSTLSLSLAVFAPGFPRSHTHGQLR